MAEPVDRNTVGDREAREPATRAMMGAVGPLPSYSVTASQQLSVTSCENVMLTAYPADAVSRYPQSMLFMY